MCQTDGKMLVAKEDIKCWKIARKHDRGSPTATVGAFFIQDHRVGKWPFRRTEYRYCTKTIEYTQGRHESLFEDTAGIYVLLYPPGGGSEYSIVLDCIIPKGTKYIPNEFGSQARSEVVVVLTP